MHPPHCLSVFSKAWIRPSLFPASENPGELLFIESGLSSLAWPVAYAILHTLVLAYFPNLVFNYENCIAATLSFSPSSGHTTLSHAITTLHMTNRTPRTDSSSLPQPLQVVIHSCVCAPSYLYYRPGCVWCVPVSSHRQRTPSVQGQAVFICEPQNLVQCLPCSLDIKRWPTDCGVSLALCFWGAGMESHSFHCAWFRAWKVL